VLRLGVERSVHHIEESNARPDLVRMWHERELTRTTNIRSLR
jgi:hypothetical protein